MTKWRPEGWQKQIGLRYGAIGGIDATMFEAGADAMLEAVKKQSVKMKVLNNSTIIEDADEKLVFFIPDDKEN